MKNSSSEHSKKINRDAMKDSENESRLRSTGRSSIATIPLPEKIIIPIPKREFTSIEPIRDKSEEERLREEMCNSYRFLVNYGVFESNFEWLPFELLIHIFDYLNTRDLLTVAMVCRQWMEATQYFQLTRKVLLHLQIFKYLDTSYPMNRFVNCSRFFPNIKFSIVKFTPKNDIFWEDYGSMVETLTFNSCLISKCEFLRIIRLCPNLKKLDISRCDDLYKSWSVVKKLNQVKLKFHQMESLAIHETSLLTNSVFNFLVTSMPYLTSLTLENCFGNTKPIERSAILNSVIAYITKRPETIKALNLVNTPTDDLFLEHLAEIKNLKLDEMRLTFNGTVATVGKSGIITLLRNQKYLSTLDLTDSKGLSNLCLIEICKSMTQLKKLILTKCWLINDVGLREVSRLLSLQVLNITSCDRVTDLGILEGLIPHGRKFFKLKELYLGLLPYMSILAIYRLSQQYDELEVLDLSGSSNSITDEALQMIFRYQLKLKHLNLDCCAKITDFGITGYSEHSDEGSIENYIPYTINNLKYLRSLNLSGCYQITDKSFLKTFNLPELNDLNLSRCHAITEVAIVELCKKCPFIEALDLSECYHIVDDTIEILTEGAVRLKTLKLNGCKQITDEIFEYIEDNCKYLQNLYIRRCPNILSNPFEVLKGVRYIHNR